MNQGETCRAAPRGNSSAFPNEGGVNLHPLANKLKMMHTKYKCPGISGIQNRKRVTGRAHTSLAALRPPFFSAADVIDDWQIYLLSVGKFNHISSKLLITLDYSRTRSRQDLKTGPETNRHSRVKAKRTNHDDPSLGIPSTKN